ncbi:MAG: winged helix-turn-helix domain-containing protein [Pseudomonadota bacterium]
MHYQLDDRAIYPSLREVWSGKDRVAVEPKVFDLIHYLLLNRERVVEKDELIDRIWDGRAISDAALSSAVSAARGILGDTGREQKMIRTIHGRGFRHVGPVSEIRLESPENTFNRDLTDGSELVAPSRASIAVLPFASMGDGHSTLLANGLAQDITVGLARTRWLFVTSGASARRLFEAGMEDHSAARKLGVRYLLRGSVIQVGKKLHLSVILSDVESEGEIWAETFNSDLGDVFDLLQNLANQVCASVANEIDLQERRRAVLRPIDSLDAWAAVHRAADILYRFTPDRFEEAQHLLEMAKTLDPGCARAPAMLSFLYWQRSFFGLNRNCGDDTKRAIEFAQESLVLDPHDPQGHWALGRTAILTGESGAAVEALSNAVEFNPNFANGHYSLALARLLAGDSAESFEHVEKARRLSPFDPMTFAFAATKGMLHSFSGAHGAAVDAVRWAVRQPTAHFFIFAMAAFVHERAGMRKEAMAYVADLKRLRPDFSRRGFAHAFPFEGPYRASVDEAFQNLGF